VVIAGQCFPIGENPRQVAIPREMLEGIRLSELPSETAVRPVGLPLPAMPGQASSCRLFAFRDGMAWIQVEIMVSADPDSLAALACLREAVRERQDRLQDVEEDDLGDCESQDCELQNGEPARYFTYIVPFGEDVAVADALSRVAAIARELDQRCRELVSVRIGATE